MPPVEIDDRLISLTIVVGGKASTYTGLYISATGTRYANENENDCEIRIANLTRETQNEILTKTTLFTDINVEKSVLLYAGRKSYGMSLIYAGNITAVEPSQPPDIFLTIRALTGVFFNGNVIARTQPQIARLSEISAAVAKDLGVSLVFQANNYSVANYSYTGPALKQIRRLNEVGPVDAYLDNGTLVVKNYAVPLTNRVRTVSQATGMVGIPQVNEVGVKVTYLLDNTTILGSGIKVDSVRNPAANGTYVIYKLGFDIATREPPFYWVAYGMRVQQ